MVESATDSHPASLAPNSPLTTDFSKALSGAVKAADVAGITSAVVIINGVPVTYKAFGAVSALGANSVLIVDGGNATGSVTGPGNTIYGVTDAGKDAVGDADVSAHGPGSDAHAYAERHATARADHDAVAQAGSRGLLAAGNALAEGGVNAQATAADGRGSQDGGNAVAEAKAGDSYAKAGSADPDGSGAGGNSVAKAGRNAESNAGHGSGGESGGTAEAHAGLREEGTGIAKGGNGGSVKAGVTEATEGGRGGNGIAKSETGPSYGAGGTGGAASGQGTRSGNGGNGVAIAPEPHATAGPAGEALDGAKSGKEGMPKATRLHERD